MTTKELTEKQKIFCMEYIKDFNGTRAYMRAYPSCKKDTTAGVMANKLLKNTKVKTYLEQHMSKIEERFVVDTEALLREAQLMALHRPSKAFHMMGEQVVAKDINDLPEEIDASIKGINTTTSENGDLIFTNYTFQDKKGALDMLFRHKSLYNDKLQVEHKSVDDLIMGNKE